MVKHAWLPALALASLCLFARAASSAETGAKTPKTRPAAVSAAAKSKAPAPVPQAPAKPSLGDGIIAQNTLRIYLSRSATVTVHNARGQLLFHVESSRPTEYLPLSGVHAGFLYLTLRSGPLETTRKLVYSGK